MIWKSAQTKMWTWRVCLARISLPSKSTTLIPTALPIAGIVSPLWKSKTESITTCETRRAKWHSLSGDKQINLDLNRTTQGSRRLPIVSQVTSRWSSLLRRLSIKYTPPSHPKSKTVHKTMLNQLVRRKSQALVDQTKRSPASNFPSSSKITQPPRKTPHSILQMILPYTAHISKRQPVRQIKLQVKLWPLVTGWEMWESQMMNLECMAMKRKRNPNSTLSFNNSYFPAK